MIISKCSYLICCKRQVQKPINVFFSPFLPRKAVQFPSVYTMSDLHCQLSSYLMVEYLVSAHMIATASNSTTAKSFLDSCLLCTSPKYYHIWRPLIACEYSRLSFAPATTCESRRVTSIAAWPCRAVRYLFVTQCFHPSLGGRGRAISVLTYT